ncbi:glycosyltransferase [Bacillus sp. NTK074B]|uniref:glycosyltransferase n=1 Tax=Bacillus sp. NTK074B TaxID=2802174 RepID=UPI001A8C1ED2|nr:glycosyltransferase [Bacillus sp. NTK074B]
MNVVMLLFKDVLFDARVKREALALAESGYKVDIFCLNEFKKSADDLNHGLINVHKIDIFSKTAKASIQADGQGRSSSRSVKRLMVKVIRAPFVKLLKDMAAYKQFGSKVKALLNHHQAGVDIIHCHDLNTLQAGITLSKAFQAKVVYDSHELFNEMAGRNDLDRWYGYRQEGKLMKMVDELIVVNPYMKEEFQRLYGEKSTTIIQNTPIHQEDCMEMVEEDYFRKKYNLSASDIILLYQGGINPHRGLEEILQAIKVLPENYKLVLMGEGRLTNHLITLSNSLGIAERVYFHPQVPSAYVLGYTKEADIGLVMYRNTSKNNYISTPNKIFEYMIAGIPTISSDHPGKSYIINKENTGICSDETPDAIASSIKMVIKNYDYYQNNCKVNFHKYTWQVEKEKLVNLYTRLKESYRLTSDQTT